MSKSPKRRPRLHRRGRGYNLLSRAWEQPGSESVPTLKEVRQITSRLETPLSEYVLQMRRETGR